MLKYKMLLILAKTWIVFGLAIIFLGFFQAYNDGGWSELWQKISMFDPRKLIGYAILLAPGFVFLWWAKKYEN